MADFYVYVHRRSDSGMPFYVGKGKGARANVTQHRNAYWRNVASKAGGWRAEIVLGNIEEEMAHLAEMELISKYRAMGIPLTNLTDGGEGMSGYKPSAETLAKRAEKQRGQRRPTVSAKLKGRPKSHEHRAKLSEARKGIPLSAEVRANMSAAQRASRHRKPKQKDLFSRHGRKDSGETRARKSAAMTGERNPRFGVRISEEQKLRQIASLKARPKVACPHCGKMMDEANARRWHGENCKEAK